MSRIIDETKTIDGVYFGSDEFGHYRRSDGYVITAYGEPGHMANIAWIEVTRGGELHSRFPASMVEIVYSKDKA